MHEVQTIEIDVPGVCHSVCLLRDFVGQTWLNGSTSCSGQDLMGGANWAVVQGPP